MSVTPPETPPATNKDATLVRVWKSFTLYRAELATDVSDLPTSLTDALPSSLIGMGNTDNTGVVENPGQTTFDSINYEGQLLRRSVSAGSYSLDLTFDQTDQNILEAWYANAAADGAIIFDPLAESAHFTWVAQMFDGASQSRRVVMPDGQLIRNGNSTASSKAEAMFPFSLVGYPSPLLPTDAVTGRQGYVKVFDSSLPTS